MPKSKPLKVTLGAALLIPGLVELPTELEEACHKAVEEDVSEMKYDPARELDNIYSRQQDPNNYHVCVETGHMEADAVLCDVLEHLGHGDLVKKWSRIKKWYS